MPPCIWLADLQMEWTCWNDEHSRTKLQTSVGCVQQSKHQRSKPILIREQNPKKPRTVENPNFVVSNPAQELEEHCGHQQSSRRRGNTMSATPSTSPKRLPRDPVADESEDELDDEYIQEQLDATMWSDLKKSFWDSRFAAPIFALLGFLLAYHLTIAPYRTNPVDQENRNAITDLVRVNTCAYCFGFHSIDHISSIPTSSEHGTTCYIRGNSETYPTDNVATRYVPCSLHMFILRFTSILCIFCSQKMSWSCRKQLVDRLQCALSRMWTSMEHENFQICSIKV